MFLCSSSLAPFFFGFSVVISIGLSVYISFCFSPEVKLLLFLSSFTPLGGTAPPDSSGYHPRHYHGLLVNPYPPKRNPPYPPMGMDRRYSTAECRRNSAADEYRSPFLDWQFLHASLTMIHRAQVNLANLSDLFEYFP